MHNFLLVSLLLVSATSCLTRPLGTLSKSATEQSGATGIKEIDTLFRSFDVNSVESLQRFLNDEEQKKQYFEKLQVYFGAGCFQRDHFDAIMREFKGMVEAADSPEKTIFFERFFSASSGTEFDLVSDVVSYNRSLDEAKLVQYLQAELLPKLRFETSEFQKIRTEEAGNALAAKSTLRLSEELATLEDAVDKTLPAKKQREELGRIAGSFTKGANKPLISDIARWFLLSEMRENSAIFIRRNPDIILSAFATLAADAGKRRAKVAGDLKGLQSAIDKLVPTVKDLLAREDVFPKIVVVDQFGIEQTRKARSSSAVRFVPVPQRIHSAFKGIPGAECVNGGGGYAKANMATAARWATAMLTGSTMHYAEENGKYVGFSEWIPVKYLSEEKPNYTGKIFATMSLGGSFLTGQTTITEGNTSAQVPTWKLWLESAIKQYPADWLGVAKASTCSADHGNICYPLQQDVVWRESEQLGGQKNFDHLDGMGQYIANVLPWNPNPAPYGPGIKSNMITDITIWWNTNQGPTDVRRLNLEKLSTEVGNKQNNTLPNPALAECKPIDWNGFLNADVVHMQSADFQKEFSKCLGSQPWFKQLRKDNTSENKALIASQYTTGENAMKSFYASIINGAIVIEDQTLLGQLLSIGNATLKNAEALAPNRAQYLTSWKTSLPLIDIIAFRMKGFENARKKILEDYIRGIRAVATDAAQQQAVTESARSTLKAGPENEISSYISGLLELIPVQNEP
jgi:hypothetical protein